MRTWQQAATACRAGRWEEGRRLVEPLLSRHPEEADLWLLWGLILWQAGQEAEAAGALLRIDACPDTLGRLAGRTRTAWEVEFRPWPLRVELPSAPGVDLLQAYLLARTGRHGEAVAQLDGALALNPGYHAARLLKALILLEGHRGARPRVGGRPVRPPVPEPPPAPAPGPATPCTRPWPSCRTSPGPMPPIYGRWRSWARPSGKPATLTWRWPP